MKLLGAAMAAFLADASLIPQAKREYRLEGPLQSLASMPQGKEEVGSWKALIFIGSLPLKNLS
jgi:hypothetical protein